MPPLLALFELLFEIEKHPIIFYVIKTQFYIIKNYIVKKY
jgi:hypothetical protein